LLKLRAATSATQPASLLSLNMMCLVADICRLTGQKEETGAHWRHLAPDWQYILTVSAGH